MNRSWRDILPFLAPAGAHFLVFLLLPLLTTLTLAFFRWDPFSPPVFVGFTHFNALLASHRFWYYLGNTLVFLLGLPLTMAGALALACVLDQRLRFVHTWRALYYLPTLVNSVALFLLWRAMFNKEGGLINATVLPLLRLFGCEVDGQPITIARMPDWLNQAVALGGVEFWLAKPALVLMGVWCGLGGGALVLYGAALASVPPELHEAAALDGASRWQRFRHVTWPALRPTTFFILVTGTIAGLQGGFEMAFLMTGGGPDESTTTLGYMVWVTAFKDFQFGAAAAASCLLAALTGLVAGGFWRAWGRG